MPSPTATPSGCGICIKYSWGQVLNVEFLSTALYASPMARSLRIEYPNAVYHLSARGNGGGDIFLGDGDRRLFLDLLAETIGRFGWLCHAYCLMGNHYHLLIETPKANLSRGMRQLNGVYTQRFNRAHGRAGHVFQGRYKAILVERDAHLLELCRYLVLNPVRAGFVRSARDWRWSSHRAMAGQVAAPGWLTTDWLLAQFGRRAAPARATYRRFVIDGRGAASPWHGMAAAGILGGDDFLAEIRAKAPAANAEVPAIRALTARPPLSRLLKRRTKRGAWMSAAYRKHGYSMREIAAAVGLHYSSISKIIRTWEKNSTFKT